MVDRSLSKLSQKRESSLHLLEAEWESIEFRPPVYLTPQNMVEGACSSWNRLRWTDGCNDYLLDLRFETLLRGWS